MNPEKRKVVEEGIRGRIEQILKPYIYRKVNSDTIDGIKNMVMENMKVHNSSPVKVDVQTIWHSWSRWQKCTWKLRQKMFKRELHLWNIFLSHLNVAIDPDNREEMINKYNQWWYADSPKHTLICDIYFKPVQPVEFISFKTTIENEKTT